MKSVCLITCYMGPLATYFNYFSATCKKNADIKFIVINDKIEKSYTDQNIQFLKMNLQELNALAAKKLNVTVNIDRPWKINDMKPMYGKVFNDYLDNTDFWGWCDLDIIWGNLRKFLDEKTLSSFDVITSKANWTAGHFTLLRNNELCNNLYKRNENIQELLNSSTYFAFEESCHRWEGKIYSFEELRAQNLPISMFDIVKQAQLQHELEARFKDVIREYPQPIHYSYKNGILVDEKNGEEFMYYHLITVKKIWRFYIPDYNPVPANFSITPYGIKDKSENTLVWKLKRAYSCAGGIYRSARKQSAGALIKKLFGVKQ